MMSTYLTKKIKPADLSQTLAKNCRPTSPWGQNEYLVMFLFIPPWYHHPLGTSEDHVDEGKLKERGEDKSCTGEEPNVDELDVPNVGHLGVGVPVQGDEGEPAGSAQGGPARNCRRLQPEGHPAHADKHGGGDVVVHHELADVPGQGDSDVEGAEVAHHLPLRHPAHPEEGGNDQRNKTYLGVGGFIL